MKIITVSRKRQKFNFVNFKVVFENDSTFLIRNGETKKVKLGSTPVKVYARQGWLKSRKVIVDNSTSELIFQSNRSRNDLITFMSLIIILATVAELIWDKLPVLYYVFIIVLLTSIMFKQILLLFKKKSDFVLIEKKNN